MAVHAAVLQLLVVSEGVYFKVLHTALLDLHMVPYLIVGLDEAIGEVGVYPVADHLPAEGFVLFPCAVDECRDGNLYLFAR